MESMSLFSLAIMLFFIMDPIGNIASYLTLMKGVTPKRQLFLLLREMGIAFLAMIIFNYLGDYIFTILGISEITVRIASGIILFLIAIKILFPSDNSFRSNLPKGEPFIVPLAIPLIAGPSLLATIMLFSSLEASGTLMLIAIVLSTLAATFVFLIAPYLHKFLGNNGLLALEKLMGMVLILLGIQRLAEGIKLFVAVYG
ncbi:MAG: antibiotic transporter [Parachlamydiaceae bacterium]|nr:antibiotic transporter [Parachlamydiaceae bacterium]